MDRGVHERFAIPYSFKPQLTLAQAAIAAVVAFLRIFLGSLLFAVWGAYSLAAWTSIRSPFWRIAVVLPMAAGFLLSFCLLMIAISALDRSRSPRRS